MGGRVAVAMSGGVDSAVAAALLQEAGHDLIGFHLHLWDGPGDGSARQCCGARDRRDARAVAGRLGIPFYILDFKDTFRREVLAPFAADYLAGRTPSPCVLCNSEVKFRRLQDMAARLGADRIATGHYARVEHDSVAGRYRLRQGRDRTKDQSYFLFDLDQGQLAALVLPLGDRTKEEVRRLAAERDLPVAEKEESQDLCFAGPDGYRPVIDAIAPGATRRPGSIVDSDGRSVGRHDGIERFTVGQRRGLRISSSEPMYVVGLDPDHSEVVVAPRRRAERNGLVADRVNWIPFDRPPGEMRVRARIRSRHAGTDASIREEEPGTARVRFQRPEVGVAPGQAVVFYDADEVVGGGWIRESY